MICKHCGEAIIQSEYTGSYYVPTDNESERFYCEDNDRGHHQPATPELELAEAIGQLAEVNRQTAEDLKEISDRETFRQMDAMRTYYASERGC
jgi:hypothetical protein